MTENPPTILDPATSPGTAQKPRLPQLGPVGLTRWAWRQLTSMRTALFLLLLLAVASVPGSIWPQRNIDAARVADYLTRHPALGPWLDRLQLFDVYGSPWFAAIYLLLVISLVGCVIPRTRLHWRAIRAQPPATPRRLERLPVYLERQVDADPEQVLTAARAVLSGRGFRLRRDAAPGCVSAERGYLRESGNLVFHLSLTLIVLAVAVGHLLGWRGDVIVPAGASFASSVSSYDTLNPGPWVDTSALPTFDLKVDRFTVTFEDNAQGAQFGAPREFTVDATTRENPAAAPRAQVLSTNHPLTLGGASVYLLGNGYAPVVTVRDGQGRVVYDEPTPFLPQDNNYRSTGSIKVPGAAPQQLGFSGLFLPTATIDPTLGPTSVFPDLKSPALVLTAYEGDLFPGGRPQSVYSLNTTGMTQVTTANRQPLRVWLTPGATVQLPGGRGSISLGEVRRWAGLSVRHDPGKGLALAASLLALAGLMTSLTVRRRRIFLRVLPGDGSPGPTALVRIAGIARHDDPALADLVETLLDSTTDRLGTMR